MRTPDCLLPDEESILARAIEGGAFDEVLDWAQDLTDEESATLDQEWWRRLAEVASALLDRSVAAEDVHLASSVGFWGPVNARRRYLRCGR